MPTASLLKINSEQKLTDEVEKTTSIEIGQTLYEAFEDDGIELPHGCLAGSCGSCKVVVTEGDQFLKAPGAIEKDSISHITETYNRENGETFLQNKVVRMSCRAKLESEGDIKFAPFK